LVEAHHDEKGIICQKRSRPQVYLASLSASQLLLSKADKLYEELNKRGYVLYDDRDLRAGENLLDADLLGLPHRIVISDKLLRKASTNTSRDHRKK